MTVHVDRYRCFLVGSESLLIECGENLLRQGHEILGVVTAAKKITKWATNKGLRVVDAAGDYRAVLAEQPFDYLFSITYLSIIPDDVLALPTRGAINFHDGPLPRYAGLNTPVWALLRGETQYAVTWHWMTAGVDTGDILIQKPVEIATGDTALTLNTKCFHAGMESFGELLGLLMTGAVSPRPQDLSQRQYFAKHDRPVAAGVVDFTKSASECETLIRALNHGRYVNPVATAKVRRNGRTFVVTDATVVATDAPNEPGTIVDVAPDAITVGCGAGALQLRGFTTTCGKPLTPAEIAEQAAAAVGERFDALTPDDVVGLTELNKLLARHEAWWVRRLESLDPAAVPYAGNGDKRSDAAKQTGGQFAEARQVIPPQFLERFGRQAGDALVCAFAAYLARVGEKSAFDIAYADEALHEALAGLPGWCASHVPLRLDIDTTVQLGETVARHVAEFAAVRKRRTYLHDVLGRYPELHDRPELAAGRALGVCVDVRDRVEAFTPAVGPALTLVVSTEQATIRWVYDATRLSSAAFATIRGQFANLLAAVAAAPETPLAEVELLTQSERKLILRDWNNASADYRRDACVHTLFAEQAARTPEAVAVAFEDRELTYRELDARAERLAAHLCSLGVGPDRLVGIHLERSEQLVIAVLATLKAGGAYLPLDPNYPDDRIAFMIEDAAAPVIITESETIGRLPAHKAAVVTIDAFENDCNHERRNVSATCSPSDVKPHNLAYVIYTSGSTGKPKGVMIEHRNAVNFFAGMDQQLDVEPTGTWLAVTSLSFDIHVLELLWTLTRGYKVVVHRDRDRVEATAPAASREPAQAVETQVATTPTVGAKPVDFSLFYFSADSEAETSNKYRLLLEGAKWGDAHGFNAVWTPERHFHSFGGLYPNPAVTGAAVAAITKHVQIRAGSVVLPLHHPVRVAEAWQIVDNLSNGRVGISVAAGWQPNDFLLMPENFKDAKNVMFRDLEIVKRLWRGEKVEFPGATGKPLAVETLPRPIQKELPVWVTTAGNIDTYVAAGRIGAHVLTHLLGQSVDDLAPKIAAYREARAAAGFDPNTGIVSLMLHTFVGSNADQVREVVRGPLKAYLGTSLNLLKQYAWSFPAFTRPKNADTSQGNDFESLTPEEQDGLLDFAFERYYETSGLFGTPDEAVAMVDRVRAIGVNEVACLIDFGVATDTVLNHLPYLNEVREKSNAPLAASLGDARDAESARGRAPRQNDDDYSLPALFRRHNVTHFQCTPSLARMLLSDDEGRAAVRNVKNFLVGGEALPVDLARDLKTYVGGRVINMYGPTETTVWSTAHEVDDVRGAIPIGRPLANQQVYVLDKHRKPVPVGVPGELYIAGDGVTRGYLNRPELTADRFVHDPFSAQQNAKMYRTGDLVRHRGDGVVEFLGRTDHQVKIRGHRIELGEIESRLTEHPHVRQAVLVPREVAPGDVRLVAYYVADGAAPADADLRVFVRAKLPEYMAPQHFIVLDALPLTPNGKIDRRALPALDLAATAAPTAEYVAPTNDLERTIAELWQTVLGREQIGVDDNFFDIGGHSLLVVRMHRQLQQAVSVPVALTDLFRFPTIRTLVAHLSGTNQAEAAQEGTDRANKRRELQQRRRIVKR